MLSMTPSSIAAISVAGKAAEAAEHANGEYPPDIFAADRRLDRLNDDK